MLFHGYTTKLPLSCERNWMYKSWRLTIDLKNVGRCRSVLGVGRVAVRTMHKSNSNIRALKKGKLEGGAPLSLR